MLDSDICKEAIPIFRDRPNKEPQIVRNCALTYNRIDTIGLRYFQFASFTAKMRLKFSLCTGQMLLNVLNLVAELAVLVISFALSSLLIQF
ncbi:hypothetical protein TUM4636_04540 [Shewanella glacialipiscicola]|uniref:Uncharacterized protein n=1 Tax=Shewanella glacialipiscicola TaxID=614069 RepID=A0ABQ6J6K5_9GAMM|nr:hypothetical protein TUM4636_04540 [Shewanella glacialipiscicola]GMA83384.1 hypothetical protein GCM10025855_29170 [Shewanella glacialipiscicola]